MGGNTMAGKYKILEPDVVVLKEHYLFLFFF
jgi:hypothetical protein